MGEVSLFSTMETCSMEYIVKINKYLVDSITLKKKKCLKDFSKKINCTAMAFYSISLLNIKANFCMDLSMELGMKYMLIWINIKENSKMIKKKGKGNSISQTVTYTMDSFQKIKSLATEN